MTECLLFDTERYVERVGTAPHEHGDNLALLELPHELRELLERFHVLIVDRKDDVARAVHRVSARRAGEVQGHRDAGGREDGVVAPAPPFRRQRDEEHRIKSWA